MCPIHVAQIETWRCVLLEKLHQAPRVGCRLVKHLDTRALSGRLEKSFNIGCCDASRFQVDRDNGAVRMRGHSASQVACGYAVMKSEFQDGFDPVLGDEPSDAPRLVQRHMRS